MNSLNVIISNATGTENGRGVLHLASGVIELENGTISHVQFELTFNRSISVIKPLTIAAPEQSEEGKVKRIKRK